jgi:hypothetical protein
MYIYIYKYTYLYIYTHRNLLYIQRCCFLKGAQKERVGPNFRLAADEAMRLQEELQARQLECDVRGGVW